MLCWAIFGDFGDLWPNQLWIYSFQVLIFGISTQRTIKSIRKNKFWLDNIQFILRQTWLKTLICEIGVMIPLTKTSLRQLKNYPDFAAIFPHYYVYVETTFPNYYNLENPEKNFTPPYCRYLRHSCLGRDWTRHNSNDTTIYS